MVRRTTTALTGLSLVAAGLLVRHGSLFVVGFSASEGSPAPPRVDATTSSLRRTPATPEQRQRAGFGTAAAAVATGAIAVTLALLRTSKVSCQAQRGGRRQSAEMERGPSMLYGLRDILEEDEIPMVTKQRLVNAKGFRADGGFQPRLPSDDHARACLVELEGDCPAFIAEDYWRADTTELSADEVKVVGSVAMKGEDRKMVGGETPPTFEKHNKGYLEQDPGAKVPPANDNLYIAHMEKRCNLESAVNGAGVSTSGKDIVCDRSVLQMLMSFTQQKLNATMTKCRCFNRPTDLVKVSKIGDALCLERLFDFAEMSAEYKAYRGSWRRKEVTQGGYLTAFTRLSQGETDKTVTTVGGRTCIAGKSAGPLEPFYSFSEFQLGGLSFLTRTQVHATAEGGPVELKTKNRNHRQLVTQMDTYLSTLLGGVDKQVICFHGSGKIAKVFEATTAGLLEQEPELADVAAKQLGRMTALLKDIKEAADKQSGSGPWVLQFCQGELKLGEYKKDESELDEMPEPPPSRQERYMETLYY